MSRCVSAAQNAHARILLCCLALFSPSKINLVIPRELFLTAMCTIVLCCKA